MVHSAFLISRAQSDQRRFLICCTLRFGEFPSVLAQLLYTERKGSLNMFSDLSLCLSVAFFDRDSTQLQEVNQTVYFGLQAAFLCRRELLNCAGGLKV